MVGYAYVQSSKNLKKFIENIPKMAIPTQVTKKTLSSLGFSSSKDIQIISVLEQIRFLNPDHSPTDLWRGYRGEDGAKILAKGIKEGYHELFGLYPDAHQKSEVWSNFFSTNSSVGKDTVSRMIRTFDTLCNLADFNGLVQEPSGSSDINPSNNVAKGTEISSKTTESMLVGMGTAPTININIQLSLPETKDCEVYDNLFLAMKKHLFN